MLGSILDWRRLTAGKALASRATPSRHREGVLAGSRMEIYLVVGERWSSRRSKSSASLPCRLLHASAEVPGCLAPQHAVSRGCWAKRVCEKVVKWDEHIRRGSCRSWASVMISHRDSAWLRARRLAQNSVSVFAGRLASRLAPSRPRTRWEEGIEHARAVLSAE